MPYAKPAFLAEHTAAAHDDGRSLQSTCGSGETFVKVEVLTDNSGFETSWKIRKLSGALVIASAGPPEGTSYYDDNMNYTGGICVGAGSYTFTIFDKFGDGMWTKLWPGTVPTLPQRCREILKSIIMH